jgi:hypothetical protein
MGHPTSFRLPPQLLAHIGEEAALQGITTTALVTSLLDEGIKTRRFPAITYRDGPTGRRAALIDGPDVWEIIRRIGQLDGSPDERIRTLLEETALTERQARLAVDFYAAYPDEIDERIAMDERAMTRIKAEIAHREALFAR